MTRKPITKDLTSRILNATVFTDQFKNDQGELIDYTYLEISFNKKDGKEYVKRFKGLSADTIEILDNLTAPVVNGSSLLGDDTKQIPVTQPDEL